ncbi:hypothetical protein Y032_0025g1219 [Ancylostoma ceylanicum]|uniref:Uncharacterized protein n=1 Tax=Ancylostoma ceylanicum TaxID=53326 RepID=A0A016UUS2_9BILA|nr:hypothetical protein Y032_0025g1219 [Ancylostoma ceylanicum]
MHILDGSIAPMTNQAIHPSRVGKSAPDESGRMKHWLGSSAAPPHKSLYQAQTHSTPSQLKLKAWRIPQTEVINADHLILYPLIFR